MKFEEPVLATVWQGLGNDQLYSFTSLPMG